MTKTQCPQDGGRYKEICSALLGTPWPAVALFRGVDRLTAGEQDHFGHVVVNVSIFSEFEGIY
jgi:histidyl-tRNA synthetase